MKLDRIVVVTFAVCTPSRVILDYPGARFAFTRVEAVLGEDASGIEAVLEASTDFRAKVELMCSNC